MNWRFWRKQHGLQNIDPNMLAYAMMMRMANQELPFNRWHDDDDVIPERPREFIQLATNIYQLCIFLDFIEQKFGHDVSGLVRYNLIAQLTTKGGGIGGKIHYFFDAVPAGRASPEREGFFAGKPDIQIDCNVARAILSFTGESEEDKHALFPILGKCLSCGRISATAAFKDVVDKIEFRPETIVGLTEHR